jgi:transketolase
MVPLSTVPATFDRPTYERIAAEWRYIITDMICRAGSGHLGGALSLVEVVMTLYFRILRTDPANPRWDERDRLVLSKGHGAPVLYLALASRGFFPADWLGTLNADGTRLPSHADARYVPGIDMTTGSLGQGLSCACGAAYAARQDEKRHRVFCIIGDGESNEGQIWEAALFGGHHQLENLIAITDDNKLQIDGFTSELLSLEPLQDKWRAFGWETFEADGHDWDSLYDTFQAALAVRGKPVMIIAHTVKAKGCSLVENKPESHNIKVPDQATYDRFMNALQIKAPLPY